MPIPSFTRRGTLPPGIHEVAWPEFVLRFGFGICREELISGLKTALLSLRSAGCKAVYVDGSFVTAKMVPGDFDACWSLEGVDPERLDPVLLTFDNGRQAQKAKFGGELFPAEVPEGGSGRTFLQFFQTDKETGGPRGSS